MTQYTKRRLAIGALIVAALAVLWVLLHLWPTHTDTAESSMQNVNTRMSSGQAHALRRGYYLYRTGHPRAAHKTLRRAFGSESRIPKHRNAWRTGTWSANRATASSHGCRVTEWDAVDSADVVNVRLFSTHFVQRFCWGRRHGRQVVTRVGRLHARQSVSGFGEFLAWSAQGILHGDEGGWCFPAQYRICHISTKEVRYHQCTPTPLGGIFCHDHDVWGWMYVYNDGQARLDV